MRIITKGATSKSIYVVILDSASTTGGRKTGIAYNSAGLTAYYALNGASAVAITLATLAAANSAFSSGGFKEIDATNMPGVYRLDVPNAALTGADSVVITLKGASGMVQVDEEIQLTGTDLMDAVRGGMTALPNANAEAAGGLYTRGTGAGQINQPANGMVDSNMVRLLGTAVSTPATAGIMDVNTIKVTNVAQTARDLGASVLLSPGTGTGQLDITSGVVKANLVQILATALTETAGQIAAGFRQFFNIASPTSTMNTITTVSTVTTATTLTNAPSDSSGVTTLLNRLSAARAGYLDNLSAGAVALASTLSTVAGYVDTEVQLILDRLGAFTGTGVNTVLGFFKAVMKKDASIPSDLGGTYDPATDSLEWASEDAAALRDFGIMQVTTIATLSSQTVFTLTNGSSDNNAYPFSKVLITKLATEEQKCVGVCASYVGSTKQITLQEDPAVFTIAAGDRVTILTPAVDVFKRQVDGTTTFEQSQRLQNSAAAGKLSGAGTTAIAIRDLADTKDRISATVDASGNRSAITRNVT